MSFFPYADPIRTGQTLYAFAFLEGTDTLANLTDEVFEAYTVLNWTDYAIPMVETSPGVWFGEWPAWFPTGRYFLPVRRQLGGSPASSDGNPLAQGTLPYAGTSPPPPPGTLPATSGEWIVRGGTDDTTTAGTQFKRPTSLEWFAFSFGNLPQIAAGGSVITTVTVDVSAGLTLEDYDFNSHKVAVQVSGGTANADYTVTLQVTLDDGTVLNPVGTLKVR